MGKRFSAVDLVVKFTYIGCYNWDISLMYQEFMLHYVYMYMCVYIYNLYGKLRDSWEEINITVHFILQQNIHMKSEHSETISFRNAVFESYIF